MDKILVTGGSGLLGSNISKLSIPRFDVYATYNKHKVSMDNVNYFQANFRNKESFVKIEDIKPDLIIHCAALTDVDYCEECPDEAYMLNVVASIHMAEVAERIGSYLIYISTDSVFDGKKGNYNESNTPNPINIYGKTKLEAEEKILSIHSHSCIVRTNIYGWNKIDKFSLAEWMLNKLINNEELMCLKDVYFSPIFVNHLAKILFKLQEKKYEGIIHIAANESCSKLDFAYKIVEVFSLNKELIKPAFLADIGLLAPRPQNATLNVSKCETVLNIKLPGVEEGLRHMMELKNKGYVEELKSGQ